MFNLVLFGPPGAGKGTQAEKLIEKYGFNHISTGEVIREQIRKGTELGRSVQSYIEKGQLAPDPQNKSTHAHDLKTPVSLHD